MPTININRQNGLHVRYGLIDVKLYQSGPTIAMVCQIISWVKMSLYIVFGCSREYSEEMGRSLKLIFDEFSW